MFDRYYDEIEVGDRRQFRGVTITEAHVVGVAGRVGAHNTLHREAQFSKASRFGQRIAHGFLVLSASSGLFPQEPGRVIAFYGMDDVRFTAPTFIGDTIRCDHEVIGKRDKPRGGVVSIRQTITNQRDEVVCVATLHVLADVSPGRVGEGS